MKKDNALMLPGPPDPQGPETAATAVAAHAQAQIHARFMMALHRPRDMDDVRQVLLKDCTRPRFADGALYSKPVGGKQMIGPSIRFAEAALRAMGNLYLEATVVFDDKDKRMVRVSITDLETNACATDDVTVPKRLERKQLKKGQVAVSERLNTYGETVYLLRATDDEILNKVNAEVSKKRRNLILQMLPTDIVDECVEMIDKTLESDVRKDPDAARNKILDAFAPLGISVSDLGEYMGKAVGRYSPADINELKGLYQAIVNGESTFEEALEIKKPKDVAGEIKDGFAKDEKPEKEDNFGLGEPERREAKPKKRRARRAEPPQDTGEEPVDEETTAPGSDRSEAEPDRARPQETEEPVRRRRGRNKKEIIGEIDQVDLSETMILNEASDMMGTVVLDLTSLPSIALEDLLKRIRGISGEK